MCQDLSSDDFADAHHDAACCANLQEEAASVSQQREQLVLAEKLFGMDITGYPDLVQVCCNAKANTVIMCSGWCTLASSAREQPVQSHAQKDRAGLKMELNMQCAHHLPL